LIKALINQCDFSDCRNVQTFGGRVAENALLSNWVVVCWMTMTIADWIINDVHSTGAL